MPGSKEDEKVNDSVSTPKVRVPTGCQILCPLRFVLSLVLPLPVFPYLVDRQEENTRKDLLRGC